MHERTQDGMTYVQTYGKPDLFITFTCNPKWIEIINELLLPGQNYQDRHDLITRMFRLKVKGLLNLIIKNRIFGEVESYMCTVKGQKRDLPHIHLLI